MPPLTSPPVSFRRGQHGSAAGVWRGRVGEVIHPWCAGGTAMADYCANMYVYNILLYRLGAGRQVRYVAAVATRTEQGN